MIANDAGWYLLTLSGETAEHLNAATVGLAKYLDANPHIGLAEVACALQAAPRHMRLRRFVVCKSREEAVGALNAQTGREIVTGVSRESPPKVTFLFPGLGDQYTNMSAGLYRDEPRFRSCVDRCSEALIKYLGLDLREVIYERTAGDAGNQAPSREAAESPWDLRKMLGRAAATPRLGRLKETALAQPALFVIEYALADLWRSWGVKPSAMAGYSLGEYVAAALAGVFSLEESLQLVALRGELIAKMPTGAMLAVGLPEELILQYLSPHVSLSAMNGPMMCVAAGPVQAVADLEARLAADGVACRRVQTTHAFHTYMMHAAAEPLRALLKNFKPGFPQVPYLSNVTGAWIAPRQAGDPEYWIEHMCMPVRFAQALQILWGRPNNIFLEVGLGQTLSGLAMQHPARRTFEQPVVLSSLPSAHDSAPDYPSLLRTLGQLWLAGVAVDWRAFQHDKLSAEPPGLIEELYGQLC